MARRNIFFVLFFSATILAFPLAGFGFSEQDLYVLTNIKMIIFIAIMVWMILKSGTNISFFRFERYRLDKRIVPALLLLAIYLTIQLLRKKEFSVTDPVIILFLFSAGLLGALCEELAFRLFIPANLVRLGFSFKKTIVISSALFSVIHTVNFFKPEYDGFAIFNQLIFAFFIGLFLGSLFFLTRSLLFVWLYHFLVNIPGLISRLSVSVDFGEEKNLTFADNLVGSLVFLLLMSPLFIVSLYYLRKIGNHGRVNSENGGVNNYLFNT